MSGPNWYRELFITFMEDQKAQGNFEKMGKMNIYFYNIIKSGKYQLMKPQGNEGEMSLVEGKDNKNKENFI